MLYQDVRPKVFKAVVGNATVVRSLAEQVKAKDRPHAYLFHGPSGTGKTTLARIFASELGATESEVWEVNTANFRGIDDVRDLIRRTRLPPLVGSIRVVILDEVHQMTSAAQNCLLKPMEDVPLHQYYVLCSTDPGRLIATIRNRCAQYETELLEDDEVLLVLRRAYKKAIEGAPDEKLLRSVAGRAGGCPREALVLLEQVLGLEDGAESLQTIRQVEESIGRLVYEMLRGGGWDKCSKVYAKIPKTEPETLRRILMKSLSKHLLEKRGQQAESLVLALSALDHYPLQRGDEPQLIRMMAQAVMELSHG